MRSKNLLVFCIFVAILSLPCVVAGGEASILKQETQMTIVGSKVAVTELMRFPSNLSANISISLPKDAENITALLDNVSVNASGLQTVILPVNSTKYAVLRYTRSGMVEESTFVGSFTAPENISALRVKLTLPDNARLTRPVDDWGPTKAVLPKPKRVDTDGTSMTLVWEFTDVDKGQDIAFFVRYQEEKDYRMYIITALVLLAALGSGTYLVLRKRLVEPARSGRGRDQGHDINKHLKESEQQIVNILRMKRGSCEQGTLRVATGFSKAKVSGLLREMEARNIVHKEKRGNRNLVFLKA